MNKVLYSKNLIACVEKHLASELNREYQGKHPILLCVLKGAFMFLSDLVKLLEFPFEIEFCQISTYGNAQQSPKGSGHNVFLNFDPEVLRDRDVVIVEDIVDSGKTINFLLGYLTHFFVADVKVCVLLSKLSRRDVGVPIDFLGFEIPDKFVYGYGLDLKGEKRGLPDIWYLVEPGVKALKN